MFLLIHGTRTKDSEPQSPLHSTMFLLIQCTYNRFISQFFTLHSTMFLLILFESRQAHCRINPFTFHNVSINTSRKEYLETLTLYFTFHNVSINTRHIQGFLCRNIRPLHSTMFLLILLQSQAQSHLLKALHSTMFLLILDDLDDVKGISCLYIPQCFY